MGPYTVYHQYHLLCFLFLFQKQCESSIDSGNSTMATMLTGITNPYQSRGSLHSNSKPVYILPRARSDEDWPRRNPYHPSSPPVRERSR